MKTIEFSWETRENPRNSQKSIENPEKKMHIKIIRVPKSTIE
jgi:hypothetical protein